MEDLRKAAEKLKKIRKPKIIPIVPIPIGKPKDKCGKTCDDPPYNIYPKCKHLREFVGYSPQPSSRELLWNLYKVTKPKIQGLIISDTPPDCKFGYTVYLTYSSPLKEERGKIRYGRVYVCECCEQDLFDKPYITKNRRAVSGWGKHGHGKEGFFKKILSE